MNELNSYCDLKKHLGHSIVVGEDKKAQNVYLKCKTCQEILVSFDRVVETEDTITIGNELYEKVMDSSNDGCKRCALQDSKDCTFVTCNKFILKRAGKI